VRTVGGTQEDGVDVRIISATHKNLNDMMEKGEFRQDLYYRLNVIQLKMPTLRERPQDIPELTNKLLQKLCVNMGMPAPNIAPEAKKFIQNLHFPGNVRELENMLERALALCDGETITVDDLSQGGEVKLRENEHTSFDPSKTLEVSLSDYLEDIEKRAIVKALEKANNNKTAAAKLLGISFRTLRYRLSKLGLAKDGEDDGLEDDGDDDSTS
jgi:two-component system, NtrC family, response regulator PilR